VASLTLAKMIKDLYPEVKIVFGGANYDGGMGMEYFRAFPFIDYVVWVKEKRWCLLSCTRS